MKRDPEPQIIDVDDYRVIEDGEPRKEPFLAPGGLYMLAFLILSIVAFTLLKKWLTAVVEPLF